MNSVESEVDLVVDLNSEDESGMPWTLLDVAPEPALIREGAWRESPWETTPA